MPPDQEKNFTPGNISAGQASQPQVGQPVPAPKGFSPSNGGKGGPMKSVLKFFGEVFIWVTLITAVFIVYDYYKKTINENPIKNITNLSDYNLPPINIKNPSAWSVIKSPLKIEGKASGKWFFEGSFSIKITREFGTQIASGVAKPLTDWMTDDLVPFEAVIEFPDNLKGKGFIVFTVDDPFGRPKPSEYKLPVLFE